LINLKGENIMNKQKLTGVFPPVMTPFEDQKIRFDALEFNIEKMNATSLAGYMPLGSNGEFQALSDSESLAVVKTVRKAMTPGKTLIAGVGRESAYNTVEFAKACADIGIDYASVLTPHYFAGKMTDDALAEYYTYVADRCPVPVLLYNAPTYASNVTMSAELVAKLAYHPNILGMKDTSKLDIGTYTTVVPKDAEFYVLAGSINKFLDGLTKGAIGGVLSLANYMPEECAQIQKIYETGDKAGAEALSSRLKDLSAKSAGKDGVAGVKAAMDILGYKGLEPRLPLKALSASESEKIKAAFKEFGII